MRIKVALRGIAVAAVMLMLLVAHGGAQTLKPEKKSLEIAVAAFAHTTMPLLIAHEAGGTDTADETTADDATEEEDAAVTTGTDTADESSSGHSAAGSGDRP